MQTNMYKKAIQVATHEALGANIGEEQILQWVREVLTDAVDYYPKMDDMGCTHSAP